MENKNLITDPEKRHDFLLLFDVTDGNPNGDPDAGNLPRVDPETMEGLVTDVCIKRKVRDFVNLSKQGKGGFEIYVQHRGILNKQNERAYLHFDKEGDIELPEDEKKRKAFLKNPDGTTQENARQWMCTTFYDIRMFGAVMTTGVNCGQVRGPVQFTFGRSLDPVVPTDVAITRVALTNPEDIKGGMADDETARSGQIGRKSIVPYGLYLTKGFYSPHLGQDTGTTTEDLALFWDALQRMWEVDRSASRGFMAFRGLYIFTHENSLGNAPAHKLFERLTIGRLNGEQVPRKFTDYQVQIDNQELPDGITLTGIN